MTNLLLFLCFLYFVYHHLHFGNTPFLNLYNLEGEMLEVYLLVEFGEVAF